MVLKNLNLKLEKILSIPLLHSWYLRILVRSPHKTMGMIGFVIVGDDLSNLDAIKKVKFIGKSKKIAKTLMAEIEG